MLLLRRHMELGSRGLDDCHVQVLRRNPSSLSSSLCPHVQQHLACLLPQGTLQRQCPLGAAALAPSVLVVHAAAGVRGRTCPAAHGAGRGRAMYMRRPPGGRSESGRQSLGASLPRRGHRLRQRRAAAPSRAWVSLREMEAEATLNLSPATAVNWRARSFTACVVVRSAFALGASIAPPHAWSVSHGALSVDLRAHHAFQQVGKACICCANTPIQGLPCWGGLELVRC